MIIFLSRDKKNIQLTFFFLGQSILIPLLNLLKVREPVILFLVMLSVFTRHIVKGLASESWMYYLGNPHCDNFYVIQNM